jgi:hypothetical protein
MFARLTQQILFSTSTDLKGRTIRVIFHCMFQSSFCLLDICEAGISKFDDDNDFLERKKVPQAEVMPCR